MTAIEDVMTADLVTAHPDTPIYDALHSVIRHNITGLPVVDEENRLVGIISEKDLIKMTYNPETEEFDSGDIETVDQIMTKDVVAFDVNDSLGDVSRCLMDSNFRRVPITSDGKVVGVISRRDILANTV